MDEKDKSAQIMELVHCFFGNGYQPLLHEGKVNLAHGENTVWKLKKSIRGKDAEIRFQLYPTTFLKFMITQPSGDTTYIVEGAENVLDVLWKTQKITSMFADEFRLADIQCKGDDVHG